MIHDTPRSLPWRAKNGPISCATNPGGMERCAKITARWFSDRRSVLAPSLYAYRDPPGSGRSHAYQKASWLVRAEHWHIGNNPLWAFTPIETA